MQKYDNLGQVFRNLRTNRHISLKQISDEVVSASQISRFERGETELSIGKFLRALDNMNIEVSEFMDAVNNYQRTEQIRFMSALIPLEYERNVAGFQKMLEEEERKFKEHPEIYRYHLNTILLQSFICKCDSSIIFPKDYIEQVTDYLFTTEDWNIYEIILIGNLYLFIDIPLLHKMGQEILKRKYYYCEIGSHKNIVTMTLLNIWETCLHRDSLEIAAIYMEQIKPLIDDETDMYKRTIYLFLSGLQHYKEGEEQTGIDEMKHAIMIFEWVGSDNLANNYKKDFARFVK
ncbi:MAG: helix-turn-helix domain-containing protein [Agathobacter sp.]|nr:helix-turn-helix domain-containing protein [Agathobacter sp.]